MKKKVSIIGTVGLPACYGGFETLAEHLVNHLSDQYRITVFCSGKKYPKNMRKSHFKEAKLTYLPFEANGIQSILYDSFSILIAMFKADVLLVLGVAGAWLFPFVRLFTKKKIIVSIDGIEWKRNKWSRLAKWFLWWSESIAVKYSHIDISDNESIQDYTAKRYGTLSRVIEYGADHTMKVELQSSDKKKYAFLNRSYAFKVCRIEPENNVHVILEAFAEMPRYHLVIVGNWSRCDYGQRLRETYSTYANIHLLDPIYDQRGLDVLRSNATLYIHGHSAGGTNPSLVEAMQLGLPIIAFGVSYNKTTTEDEAFYFRNKSQLKEVILHTHISALRHCAERMKAIATRRYTWSVIVKKYDHLFMLALRSNYKSRVQPKLKSKSSIDLRQLEALHLKHQFLFHQNISS